MNRDSFSIPLGNHQIQVRWVANLRDHDGDKLNGRCNYHELSIDLELSLPVSSAIEALVHEIVHLATIALGEDDEWEEKDVQRFGFAMAQMLAPLIGDI